MIHKLVLIIGLLLGIFFSGYSQNEALSIKITYSTQQKPLNEVLQDIEKLTEIRFTYNNAIISDKQLISISVNQKTLLECLNLIFKNSYSYKQIGNQILIFQPEKKTPPPEKQKITPPSKTHQIVYDTVRVYDTIRTRYTDTVKIQLFDTIRYFDTIAKSIKIKKSKPSLSISVYSGPMISIPLFTSSKNTKYALHLQESTSVALGSSSSIIAMYQKKNLLVGTGVKYLDFKFNSNFSTKFYINDGTATYTDTLWYWKYNKLFTYYKFINSGDSVAITVYDSLYTFQLKENPKKIEKSENVSSIISLQYFSIPFFIGYRYSFGKNFELQPLFSFQTMILTNKKGLIPNNSNTNSIDINNLNVKRFTYSIGLTCNAIFTFHEHYAISLKPFCLLVPSVYKSTKSDFQETIPSFGLEWGFSYTIPYELF